MVLMTTCDVKGVARSDEPPENYARTLQFYLALESLITSFT